MSHRPGKRAGARVAFRALALGLFCLADASLALAAPARVAAEATKPAATAQPLPSEAPASAAHELAEGVRAAHADAERLRRIALPDSGEKRELAFGALLETTTRFRRTLIDAAASVAGKSPPAGSADELRELRSLVGSELEAEGLAIAVDVSSALQLGVKLADEVNRAAPDVLAAVEKRRNRAFGWYTQLVGDLHYNLQARTALGLNTGTEQAKLESVLREASRLTGTSLRRAETAVADLEPKAGVTLDAAAQTRLDAAREYRDLLIEAQRKFIDYLDNYGQDTVQLRQDLISTTGEMSHDILDPRVVKGLVGEWKSQALRWVTEHAPAAVFGLVSFLVILAAFGVLARIARGLVRRAFARSRGTVSGLASDFVVSSTGRLIWLLGFVIAAAQLGIEVAPLIAGLGIAGFVAGFALQDTLSNFASGMMILVYRPFDIGDLIEAGGVTGNVKAMTLVYTSVLTPDNQMLIVPNSKIWGGVIRNVTHQEKRRIDLQFAVSYRDDLEHAEAVLAGVLADDPRVLTDPAPEVRLNELADSCARFVVRPWVKTADYWEAYWGITREVKRRFDAQGFSLPYPQQALHIYDDRRLDRAARDSDIAPVLSASG